MTADRRLTTPPGRLHLAQHGWARAVPRWTLAALALCPPAAADSAAESAGFVISTYATGLSEPVAMEFAPDGRLFVAELGGTIRTIHDGTVSWMPFAHVEVFHENENGLLGLALDPDFASNGYVYVFATISRSEQQIIRFTDAGGLGVERTVIRDRLPTRGEFHSGGGLKVGPDRKLYFSIGDNLVADNAQDLSTLAGKVCRINLDGSTPDDNPFVTPTGQPRAIFALGLRNPFRFCFAPDGRMFAMDVGSDGEGRREEINLIVAGGNYGWPLLEGRQPEPADPAFIDPIHDYHEGGAAPVGAVYYTGQQFPAEYVGNLFHLEYVLNRLYRAVLEGDRVVRHEVFYEGEGGPVDLTQGPDGALYYSELQSGRIRRISYPSNDRGLPPSDAGVVAGDSTGGVELSPAAGACGIGTFPALGFVSLALAAGRRRARRAKAKRYNA